jgi:hypothetical protein
MEVNFPSPKTFYEDILYGEYRYVDENGIELINTLAQINNPSIDVFDHLIYGNYFQSKFIPPACDACTANEYRISLSFIDPEREYLQSQILIRRLNSTLVDINGNPVVTMELELTDTDIVVLPEEDSPTVNRVPYGKYIMVKQ